MTPQERDLITQLLGRLKQSGGQPKDAEADGLIRQAMADQPDAPYYLVQTVLIQDMALANAQARIADLERRVAEASGNAQAKPASFLGGLFGRGDAPAQGQPAAGPWGRAPAQPAPAAGPWQQPPAQPYPYAQPGYAPGYAPGMMQPGMMAGGGGFLRQAAATAAGIAGGALLFEGIQSMFGGHGGGFLSQAAMQPSISETVINNFYGSEGGAAPDMRTAAWNDPAGNSPGAAPGNDPGYAWNQDPAGGDPGYQDVASDQDYGGTDYASDDSASDDGWA